MAQKALPNEGKVITCLYNWAPSIRGFTIFSFSRTPTIVTYLFCEHLLYERVHLNERGYERMREKFWQIFVVLGPIALGSSFSPLPKIPPYDMYVSFQQESCALLFLLKYETKIFFLLKNFKQYKTNINWILDMRMWKLILWHIPFHKAIRAQLFILLCDGKFSQAIIIVHEIIWAFLKRQQQLAAEIPFDTIRN